MCAVGDAEVSRGHQSVPNRGDPLLSSGVMNDASRQAAFGGRATWLSPLEITAETSQQPVPPARASNLGCLNMTFGQYFQLLQWTSRQVRAGKIGQIESGKPPILHELGLAGDSWLQLVESFRGKRGGLRRAIGRPAALEAEATKRGQRWIQGIALSRAIFGLPPH